LFVCDTRQHSREQKVLIPAFSFALTRADSLLALTPHCGQMISTSFLLIPLFLKTVVRQPCHANKIGISAADKVFPALSQLAKMSPRTPGVQVAALIVDAPRP
jgi:hypothetical protein